MAATIEIFSGAHAEEYVDYISKLRIKTFKEFPYLYEGKLASEKEYVSGYTIDPKAMITIAKIDGEIAGISTGIPLTSHSGIISEIRKTLSHHKIDVDKGYYYGEVIILPEFRGQGITTQLFSAQNKLIKEWDFSHAYILTVMRDNNHKLKPMNYTSPDKLWEHLGFSRTFITVDYRWPTIQTDGSVKNSLNKLEFWIKNL